jgi:hypothetical protein
MKHRGERWTEVSPKSQSYRYRGSLGLLASQPSLYSGSRTPPKKEEDNQQKDKAPAGQCRIDSSMPITAPSVILTVLFYDEAKDFGVLLSQLCSRTCGGLRVALRDAHDAIAAGEYLCPSATVLRVNGFDRHIGVAAKRDDSLLNGISPFIRSESSNGRVDQENWFAINFYW